MQDGDLATIFGKKYDPSISDWGGHSGGGSSPTHNLPYRMFLEQFIALNDIRSVTDVGCGDWQFSRFINFEKVDYSGFDVVPELIERNRSQYGSPKRHFAVMPDNCDELPGGDLLIIKDVLQHLPNEIIFNYREKLFNKFRFCLITNSYAKLGAQTNIDIKPGDFRCLDLNAEPFKFGGAYVTEFFSPLWEVIRVLLLRP